MAFSSKGMLSGLVAALGGVLLFMGIESLWGGFLSKYGILIIAAGGCMIVFAKYLREKLSVSSALSRSLGAILLFLGGKSYLVGYVVGKGAYVALGVAVILIIFNDWIAEKISGGV